MFPKAKQSIYEAYGYSAAVRSGGFLFVSGQVGANETGNAVADPAAQFDKAFENLQDVLNAGGYGFDDVVDVTTFHVNMHEHFEAFSAAKQKASPKSPFPNWTAIGVVTLADPGLLLEIKVTARAA